MGSVLQKWIDPAIWGESPTERVEVGWGCKARAGELNGAAAVTGGEQIWIGLRDRCGVEPESRLMD